MSRMTGRVKDERGASKTKAVVNYMGGISYRLSPIETLKMVTASSIFGEPQYYRRGEFESGVKDGVVAVDRLFGPYALIGKGEVGMKTSDFMEKIIDDALSCDFEATIRWAETLRLEYGMRLNPQVIMVRAASHPARVGFNEKNPSLFSEINAKVMRRADEPASQLTYYLYRNKSKASVPNVLKRSWAKRIETASRYEVAKYKNAEVGMIDVVRICHAKSPIVDELMRTGTVVAGGSERTWENMRSAGASWMEILSSIEVPHMALLRNLRGIFTEIDDPAVCRRVTESLKAGVAKGRQFPFRYWSAMKAIEKGNPNFKPILMDALEECMDLACANMPLLKGRTMCLSDNSGSAWGAFASEYGSVTVAEIDNLSAVIAARNSEEGYVGKFGDRLEVYPIKKKDGVLSQTSKITKDRGSGVGGATENGIWIFFEKAIRKKERWDNIFIFSDMQAGHGGLYGTGDGYAAYSDAGFACRGRYVDVAKLIDRYRAQVNPKVNVFSVQTAGYDDVVVPEYGYRTNLLYGWTGKEIPFADRMIGLWDEADAARAGSAEKQG